MQISVKTYSRPRARAAIENQYQRYSNTQGCRCGAGSADGAEDGSGCGASLDGCVLPLGQNSLVFGNTPLA